MRGREAYRRHVADDWSWARVARALGFADARGAREAARRYALENGRRWPTFPHPSRERPQEAYERAAWGEPWSSVACMLGYASATSARGAVQRYAKSAGLPWPPTPDPDQLQPVPDDALLEMLARRGSARAVDLAVALDGALDAIEAGLRRLAADHRCASERGAGPMETRWSPLGPEGGRAYRLREETAQRWQTLAAELLGDEARYREVADLARRHAAAHELPWPIAIPGSGTQEETAQLAREGRTAYRHRAQGMAWHQIDARLSYRLFGASKRSARWYARLEGRAWPPQLGDV